VIFWKLFLKQTGIKMKENQAQGLPKEKKAKSNLLQ
jgi:hypothetical protein